VCADVSSGLYRLLGVWFFLGSDAWNDRFLLEDLQDSRGPTQAHGQTDRERDDKVERPRRDLQDSRGGD